MERKPLYSIFPAPPSAASSQTSNQPSNQTSNQKSRQSTDSRNRPSLEQPPYPPPQTPLPPVPTSPHAAATYSIPTSPHQPLPPTPDSLRPVRLPTRRKASPNREFADFQRELAQSSHRQPSPPPPPRGRPTSPRQRPPSKQSHHKHPPSRQSKAPSDPPDHDMQTSRLSTSSTSSLSLSKPPLLSPTTTVAPTPAGSTTQGRNNHRPKTVYFHGSIGGAGNYRKVIRENNRAPRAYAENAEPVGRRPSPTRFLSSLFGGNQKGRAIAADSTGNLDERASGSEESVTVREEVDLGAAEALRRKMLGVGRKKKGERS